MKERWANLAVREKKIVMGGGLCLLILLIYMGIWLPFNHHIAEMRIQLAAEKKLLAFMVETDQAIQKISTSTKQNKQVSSVELLSGLQQALNQANLLPAVTQLKQSSNETLNVQFQKVDFDQLIQFLITFASKHGVMISALSVKAENAPGVVSGEVVLKW